MLTVAHICVYYPGRVGGGGQKKLQRSLRGKKVRTDPGPARLGCVKKKRKNDLGVTKSGRNN
jgi:hypothetical protein